MKNKSLVFFFLIFFVNGCVGTSSQGIFGTGVSIAIDPRSLGTQIDDNIMQKIWQQDYYWRIKNILYQ